MTYLSEHMKAVAFDMDGVLINSELLKAKSYAIAAKSIKSDIPESSVIKAYRDALGGTTTEVSSSIVDQFRLNCEGQDNANRLLARRHRKEYENLLDDADQLRRNCFPEAIKTLDLCREKGIPTALVTGSSRDNMDAIVRALEINNRFKFILTANDVSNTKPDPESYLRCSSYFKVDCSNLVVIEDSVSGLTSALRAGCFCIAVETEFTTEQLRESTIIDKCDVVTSPTDLFSVLSSLFFDGLFNSR